VTTLPQLPANQVLQQATRLRSTCGHCQTLAVDFQVLDKVTVPDGRMSMRKSFVVENGVSRLMDA